MPINSPSLITQSLGLLVALSLCHSAQARSQRPMECSLATEQSAKPARPGKLVQTLSLASDASFVVVEWRGDLWQIDLQNGNCYQLTTDPAQDSSPLLSQDNKTLWFNSTRAGSRHIYRMPVAGGTAAQVSFHAEGSTPQDVSSDGKSLLVLGARELSGRIPLRLFTQDATGQSPEQLEMAELVNEGRWSSDDKLLLYSSDGYDAWRKGYSGSQAFKLWLYEREGKKHRQLKSSCEDMRSGRFLGNNQSVGFLGQKDGVWNLHKLDIASGKTRALTNFKDDHIMQWDVSADGKTIVFVRGWQLYKMDLSKAEPVITPIKFEPLVDSAAAYDIAATLSKADSASFSPSGLEIAFCAGGDLWVMDTVLREPVQITATADVDERAVQFSPDGKYLYYTRDNGIDCNIYKVERAKEQNYWWKNVSFKHTALTSGETRKDNLRFSPDKKHVVWIEKRSKLMYAKLDGSEPRCLFEGFSVQNFDFSADGNWLCFSAPDNDFNDDVYLLDLSDAKAQAVNVSAHPDLDTAPQFSPDGKYLGFIGKRDSKMVPIVVALTRELADENSRQRKLREAEQAMQKDPLYAKAPSKPADEGKKNPASTADNQGNKSQPSGATANPASEPQAQPDKPQAQPDKPQAQPEKPQAQPDKPQDPAAASPNGSTAVANSDKPQTPGNAPAADKPAGDATAKGEAKGETKSAEEPAKQPSPAKLKYDLVDIHERCQILPLGPGGNAASLMWSSDSKRLWIGRGPNETISISVIPTPNDEQKLSFNATPIRSEEGRMFLLVDGLPAQMRGTQMTKYNFSMQHQRSIGEFHTLLFRSAWRTIEEYFYDENFNNLDWKIIREKYQPYASAALSNQEFNEVMRAMLGELNASHLYWNMQKPEPRFSERSLKNVSGHLGIEGNLDQNGFKIVKVWKNSPAANINSKLEVGDTILSVNNQKLDENYGLWQALTMPASLKSVELSVKNDKGEVRELSIMPVSYREVRQLHNEELLDMRRNLVKTASKGKIGYIPIARMIWEDFQKFQRDIYLEGVGKDGLIIDVRDNGGGFTTDHLLNVLCQPLHAFTVPRGGGSGYPQDRTVYPRWNKPIVVLCNQNSFSNAEIFSHAIKQLGRGKLVGVPTAGGVISTGQMPLLNAATISIPFRGWFNISSGLDQELNGAKPDVLIYNQPGEAQQAKDSQLSKAVEVLSVEIRNTPALYPKPRYRSQLGK